MQLFAGIRRISLAAGLAAMAISGCGETTETPLTDTPAEVLQPSPAGEAGEAMLGPASGSDEGAMMAGPAPDGTTAGGSAPASESPAAEETASTAEKEEKVANPPAQQGDSAGVSYEPIKFDALMKAIAENDAKYTIVDCWASWCGPCKENFPHVLEMDRKYGSKGLKVISLSFDGGTGEEEIDTKEIEAARAFLIEQKATTTNYRLDEERDLMFEKFDVSTIPGVFVYDADGKEVKRYTWDDPNNQFTYDQVEKEVTALLGIEPGE